MTRSQCIADALALIAKRQLEDGSFAHTSDLIPGNASARTTTFFTSLIVHCLAGLPTSKVVNRSTAFLLDQASPAFTWNYWSRTSREHTTIPYPDDTDDTACAWAALQIASPESIDGNRMAQIVKTLIRQEVTPGGPYRTWIVPADSAAEWVTIDLAVNANITFSLQLIGISLPALTAYLESCIERHAYASSFYTKPFPVFYYLSRSYSGNASKVLLGDVLEYLAAHPPTIPLDQALALSTLSRLHAPYITQYKELQQLIYLIGEHGFADSPFSLDP